MKNFIVTGQDTSDIIKIIKPGDVLLRGFNSLVSNFFPKRYFDGSIFIGKHSIARIKKNKAEYDNIISYLRCDKLLILRVDESKVLNYQEVKEKAVSRCHQFIEISRNYDIISESECIKEFEVPILCYKEFNFTKFFNYWKRKNLYNDLSLLYSPFFKIIYIKRKNYE